MNASSMRYLRTPLLISLTLLAGACGLREKREQGTFDRQMDRQEKYEVERTAEQMIPLNQRENVYESLRGRYFGTYDYVFSGTGQTETVTVVAELIPIQSNTFLDSDPKREMNAMQAIQGFTMNISITESSPSLPQMMVCMKEGQRIDLFKGMLTISCMSTGAEPMKRTYSFYIDNNQVPANIASAIHQTTDKLSPPFIAASEALQSRSVKQIQSLLSLETRDIKKVGLKIFSDPEKFFFAQLGSKQPL